MNIVRNAFLAACCLFYASDGLAADAPESRTFRLHYGASLRDLPEGARVRVWLPIPPNDEHQRVDIISQDLPVRGQIGIEPSYGNKILYFETTAPADGRLPIQTSYLVQRDEVRGLAGDEAKITLTDNKRRLFLAANNKVPLQGKQLDLLNGLYLSTDPVALARALYDRVDEHVRYDKLQPGYGNGDVAWVCDSRSGNCTDFHSLFMSLARAKGLPSRFEIGFPLPRQRGQGSIGGYHCWAYFYADGRGWIPVDISEADKNPAMKEYYFGNLTEDRVTFSVGRDLQLVPQQDGEPLNFFVYPYVEVEGRAWPKEKIDMSFRYADVQRED